MKELNSTDLFKLDAEAFFEPIAGYTIELSADQNQIYNFRKSKVNGGAIFYGDTQIDVGAGLVSVNTFYVDGPQSFTAYYRTDNGALLALNNGSFILSGSLFDKYKKIKFANNVTLGMYVFSDATTGNGLYTTIPDLNPDQVTVTNFAQDASTGFVTFDFTVKINAYRSIIERGQNTTNHDLTITGKFNSGQKVYKNVVSRTKG